MPFGVHLGSISPPNLVPKSAHKSIINHYDFPSYLRCLFGSVLGPFSSQLASKNPPKSIKIWCHDAFPSWAHFCWIFRWFLLPTPDPQNIQNHSFFLRKTMFCQYITFRSWHWFWNEFCSNMHPFFFQKSSKIFFKSRSQEVCTFRSYFTSLFGANLLPCSTPGPPKSHLKLALTCIDFWCWF